MTDKNAFQARIWRAQLLSTVGAGVLGAGLGLWLQPWLEGLTAVFVLAGLVTHGWGMFAKRSIEQQLRESQRFWMDIVYWLCWGALVALLSTRHNNEMNGMMDGMMWGGSLLWLLILVLVALGIVALAKYLLTSKRD
jgi:hypothetical protein